MMSGTSPEMQGCSHEDPRLGLTSESAATIRCLIRWRWERNIFDETEEKVVQKAVLKDGRSNGDRGCNQQ